MQNNKKKKYTYFIGIDVSKNELDYAVFQGENLLFHKESTNQLSAITAFISELKKLPKFKIAKALFVMEYTGIYCNHLVLILRKLKANFVQENALKIRNSSGLVRGKYDKIDAIRIGKYAVKNFNELHLWVERRPVLEQLATLNSLKSRLLGLQVALKKPLNEQKTFAKKGIYNLNIASCANTLSAIENDLSEVEKSIISVIKSDDKLKRLNEVITSVPNIGINTSVQIILSTNEFTKIDTAKKFASYAGIAPFVKDSGKKEGKARVSKIANKRVKSILHMCAISSLRADSEIKEFYRRKTEVEGKPKMSVINAIRSKLVGRIFSCVNNNRLYTKEYFTNTPKIVSTDSLLNN